MFLSQVVVGIGSMALHGTLHWFWQSADEVPMLWQNLTILFLLYTVHSKKSTRFSGFMLAITGIVLTMSYYLMRHVYGVFVVAFCLLMGINLSWTTYCVFKDRTCPEYPTRLWLYSLSMFPYLLIGGGFWVYEMHNCNELLPYYRVFNGVTLHILWHIGAGTGAYLQILLLTAMRAQARGSVVEVHQLWGFIPTVKLVGPKVLLPR